MTDAEFERLLNENRPVIRVRLKDVQGSSPRDAGTEMLVSADATAGTIGGGQLEYRAIGAARALLASGARETEMTIPLGPEIGQCCGGRVVVALTRLTDANRRTMLDTASQNSQLFSQISHVYIMGGGHVGRALANQLQHLPVFSLLIDQREAELSRCAAHVEKRLTALPEAEIDRAPKGSAFIIATHDHALDFMLTAAALKRDDAAYVGLIGSATKRAKFESWLRGNDSAASTDKLICPIGASSVRDKRPEIIAAMVTAEVLVAFHTD